MKYIFIVIFSCSFLLLQPHNVEANWASNAWHKSTSGVKHAAKKISHTAKKVTHTVKRTANKALKGAEHTGNQGWKGANQNWNIANKWANKAYHQTQKRLRDTANRTNRLAKESWDAVKNFAEHPTGNCLTLQRQARDELKSLVASRVNKAINQVPPEYVGAAFMTGKCRSDMQIGFECGPFVYASDISSSMKAGYKGMKRYTTLVGDASRNECRNVPLSIRTSCAMDVAIAKESGRSFQCIADIIKQMGKGSGGGVTFSEQKICTKVGEIGFGMAVDAEIANAAGAAKKAVKVAQLIRTALNGPRSLGLPKSCRF